MAQALLVLKLTGNGFAVGVLTACQFAPVLLLGAWAGLIADRADKRRLLIGIQCFAMAQSFALAALAFSGNPPVIAIYSWPSPAASPPPSTTPPGARSWWRWSKSPTSRTRSASTAPS